jgi:anhydro-N-acetylmuramic acid kinase
MSSEETQRIAVGLMAGNSLDGISASVLATSGSGSARIVEFLGYRLHPIPDATREALFALHYPNAFSVSELASLHITFGQELAAAALSLLEEVGIPPADAAVLGVQGANLVHAVANRDDAFPVTAHMEVGELAVVAEDTGILVVGDLRPSDIACGGEGAPLSSYVDHLLFSQLDDRSRAIQNLGGIANVTYLPSRCTLDDLLAFDCGPANMVIDRLITTFTDGHELYDVDGKRAERGTVHRALLAKLMQHPYLALTPPKTSRGPEEFGEAFVRDLLHEARKHNLEEDDILATATQYSAECMADHYERFFPQLPDEVVLTGGGAHNLSLRRRLSERLPQCSIRLHDEFGIPVDAREASTWAILADETLHGVAATAPAATGASRRSVLGKIVAPSTLTDRLQIHITQPKEIT